MLKIANQQNTQHYYWGDNCEGWHLVKTAELSIIKEKMPSGTSEKKHFHQKSQQFFYILAGIATFEVDGRLLQVEKNQGLQIAAGQKHQLFNQQSADLIFIVTSTPPSQGDRIEV